MWESIDERISNIISRFTEEEQLLYSQYQEASDKVNSINMKLIIRRLDDLGDSPDKSEGEDRPKPEIQRDKDLDEARLTLEESAKRLESGLRDDISSLLLPLLQEKQDGRYSNRPPFFDLSLIQRYILNRVLDLGWTSERFGYFDEHIIGYDGRRASKPERIGKKYQWIAYHEILAKISDNFQYHDYYGHSEIVQRYIGPWQNHRRDIDPTNTVSSTPGGTLLYGHTPSWWASARFDEWDDPNNPEDWVKKTDHIPAVQNLIKIIDPHDSSSWLNIDGYFIWENPIPVNQERTDIEHREVWLS
jgi:hypothetical protein